MLNQETYKRCQALLEQVLHSTPERLELLDKLVFYMQSKRSTNQNVLLTFICTHNSRRSHLAQVWAKTAAIFFNIPSIQTYSGGTEATAFNLNAIKALQSDGFEISTSDSKSINPIYTVKSGDDEIAVCFSKQFSHAENPNQSFAAIMTCSDAETNCPHVPGAEFRIGITYEDPKQSDNSPNTEQVYLERSRQIGAEMLYVFSKL
jgi:arsenate reductase